MPKLGPYLDDPVPARRPTSGDNAPAKEPSSIAPAADPAVAASDTGATSTKLAVPPAKNDSYMLITPLIPPSREQIWADSRGARTGAAANLFSFRDR